MWGTAFQSEGTANVKSLRQEQAWRISVVGTEWTRVGGRGQEQEEGCVNPCRLLYGSRLLLFVERGSPGGF